jgi:hypothetical protein
MRNLASVSSLKVRSAARKLLILLLAMWISG